MRKISLRRQTLCWLEGSSTSLPYADEKGKFDELVEQNGVQVLIDSPALMHLFGTKIDFVEDRIRCSA